MTKAGTNWHTPGHNSGNSFDYSPFLHGFHDAFGSMTFRTDLSVSVESLGDLSTPEGHTPLSEAQRQASEIFGSAQTCFVTNGTSTSNKAMLQTLLRPGETVLIDRNCHKSVHHAVVMSGAVPRFLPARYNARYGIWGPVALEDLEAELSRPTAPASKPRMLILTTCTYEGVLYPIWEIGRLCEKNGILFYADEAWAPHLNFHPFYTQEFPGRAPVRYNAVNELCGAHFAVQSTHKALSAFSQASMIHVSTRFKRLLEDDSIRPFRWLRRRFGLHGHGSYEKFSHDLHEFLRYWHSTSPHYPMLATLDIAGIQMRLEGLKIIEERLHWVAAFKQRVARLCGLPEDECFVGLGGITGDGPGWERQGYLQDPLKMILSFRNEKSCRRFEKQLLKARIQWEKSTPVTILFLVTAGTVEEHFEYLYRVCRQLYDCIGLPEEEFRIPSIPAAISEQAVVLPRDAALCDGELVLLEESEGRICGQMLVPYPPGIPVFLPGLRITRPMIELIRDVVETEGPAAVHGLFTRGKKYFVEVLNKDEENRVLRIDTP
jgi:arginine decarboxylase